MFYVYHNEAISWVIDHLSHGDNFDAGRHIGIALVQGIRSIGNQHDVRVESGQVHGLHALSADQMHALVSHALLSGLSSEPTKDEYHQTHSCECQRCLSDALYKPTDDIQVTQSRSA